MMAAAAWRADDFDADLRDLFGCVGEALDQVRRGLRAASGSWTQARDRGPGGSGTEESRERGSGGPWTGGPRGRGFGPSWGFGGPKGRGPWGGGFAAPWIGFWPGMSGPPGPKSGPKASRGDVRAAILALLQEGPRNGYQIMSEIEERSGGAWRPSPGAVYPALQQLADEGLISGEESDGRRTFTLTDAGREYIREHPERARGAWESPAQQEAWEVPGLFAEAGRLGACIVQIAHAGTHDQVLEAERRLERTRRDLYRILAEDAGDPDEQDRPDEQDS
jgi:DNA-binding PadR family transcriptional regulator